MTLRRSTYSFLLIGATVAIGIQLNSQAQTANKQKGRSIEFSDTKSSDVATNLNQLENKNSRLKQWEQDLSKPFQSFTPKSSLDGVIAPPMQITPSQSKRQRMKEKEALERRKNWIFNLSQDDLTGTPSAAELLDLPEFTEDGLEKNSETSMSRFFRKMDKPQKSGSGEQEEEDWFGEKTGKSEKDRDRQKEEEELRGVRDSEKSLKKMFATDEPDRNLLAPLIKPSNLTDLFGLGSPSAMPPEKTAAQKARMEEFRTLMNPPSPTSSLQPLNAGATVPPAILPSAPMVDTSMRPAFPNVVGTITPSLGARLPEPAKAASSLNPVRAETPKVMNPLPMTVPQRKF